MSGRMDKKTILRGMWWVKENENDKFTGILTYGGGYVPTLEIFPKEYDFDTQKVPNNSTIYGDVFRESKNIQAVTLLECTSEKSLGHFGVGAFIYKQEFVYADCVAIGMLLDDDEIAQVQSPQNVYLTCPGLDQYSAAHAIDYIWKDNIPKGRAYHINDLDKIVYTQPEPIVIEIDLGTITILLGQSSTARDISSRYLIHISMKNPTPKDKVNSLIYLQLLSFLSVMTGRREYIETHDITINSIQTRSDSLSIELNYGHIAHSTQETKYSILQTLLLGREKNMRKFATLFPKWRENFAFVEGLAFQYMQMVDEHRFTKTDLIHAFSFIEEYVVDRDIKADRSNMAGILCGIIEFIVSHFSYSNKFTQHFPRESKGQKHIANQLANFRHKRIHPKSDKECMLSLEEVYAHINVILRLIFLKEMEYSYKDIDSEIGHWRLWRMIDGEK